MGAFLNMNPALLRAGLGGGLGAGAAAAAPAAMARGPRLSTALAGYRGKGAAALVAPAHASSLQQTRRVSRALLQDDGAAEGYAEAIAGGDGQGAPFEGEEAVGVAVGAEDEEDAGAVGDGAAPAEPELDDEAVGDDDYEDEDEPVDEAAVAAGGGGSRRGGFLRNKLRAAASKAAAVPSAEPRALVIGKGKLQLEQAVQQVVRLKRVSKVRGDKALTAMRAQQSMRRISNSAAAFEPAASSSAGGVGGGGGAGYAFTATVGRKQLRVSTDRARREAAAGSE